jgi:RNA polymerase sigma-70 factor (ECF subfamily)
VTHEQEQQAGVLMARAQEGDTHAYEELLRLLLDDARGFVGRRVRWADWTEDVVQDILLTVHRSRHTYDPSRPFAPWYYAIANSRLVDTLRTRRRVTLHEVAEDGRLPDLPAPAPPSTDLGEAMAQAVARLPRVKRDVVSLLKYEGLSVREVAARLGMTEAAVKTTAHRSYRLLKKRLGGLAGEHRRTD